MTRGSFHKSGDRTERASMKQQGEKKAKAVVVTDPGLLNRTSWTNATVALTHIKKVRPDERCLGERDQTQPCVLRRLTLCSIEPSPC